jgi:hypothetical protein
MAGQTQGSALTQSAALGLFGRSGLYELPGLEAVERLRLDTSFGAPSDEQRPSR